MAVLQKNQILLQEHANGLTLWINTRQCSGQRCDLVLFLSMAIPVVLEPICFSFVVVLSISQHISFCHKF